MHIERIDGAAARSMDAIEELRQADEIGVVFERAGPPAPVRIGTIGRTAHWRKGNPLAAYLYAVSRIAGMEGELGRSRLQRLLDDTAAPAAHVAIHRWPPLGV